MAKTTCVLPLKVCTILFLQCHDVFSMLTRMALAS